MKKNTRQETPAPITTTNLFGDATEVDPPRTAPTLQQRKADALAFYTRMVNAHGDKHPLTRTAYKAYMELRREVSNG